MSITRQIMELVDQIEGSASDEQISMKYRELLEIARSNLAAFRRHQPPHHPTTPIEGAASPRRKLPPSQTTPMPKPVAFKTGLKHTNSPHPHLQTLEPNADKTHGSAGAEP